MRQKRIWIVVAVSIVIVITAFITIKNNERLKTDDSEINEASEFAILEMPLRETYTTTGTITPEEDDILVAPFDSRISKVNVELGQNVKTGDLLFELDPTTIEYNIRSLEYDIAVIKSSIESESIVGSLTKENTLKEAEQTLANAKEELDHGNLLYNQGALSKAELDAYELTYANAKNRLTEAQKSLDAYYAENNILLLKKKLELLELSLQDYKNDLEETRIVAPFDGVVTSLFKSAGDVLKENDEICQVTNMSLLDVEASISEYDLQKFAIGMPATISTLSNKLKTYTAEVSEIGYLGETTGSDVTLPIKLKIDTSNDVDILLPNFTVTIEILTNSSENALVVPFEAVSKNFNGESIVLKKTGDVIEPLVVKTGITNELYMEVISDALQVGDIIVYETSVENSQTFSRGIIPMGTPPDGEGPGDRVRNNN